MKIEVGKRYLRRDGKVTEPLVVNAIKYTQGNYPFKDPNTSTLYTADGAWLPGAEAEQDLVAEYAVPEARACLRKDGSLTNTRKDAPMFSGLLAYFPDALEAVARLSKAGNDKHNPGEPLHWSRDKSNDHKDCLVRHLKDAGTVDEEDGFLHDVKVAWRALASLQIELEKRK